MSQKQDREIELSYEASQDAWSFGSVLFELCTGRNLFPLDLNDDSMVEEEDLTRLCSWSCLDDKALDGVFKNCETCDPETRAQAQHLIRWCLQGDPSERPSFQKILEHPFLSQSFRATDTEEDEESEEKEEKEPTKKPTKPQQKFQSLTKLPVLNMRYHFFVSHMQVEAAGDVGTLCHTLMKLGVNCWRDMDAEDLTEAGMKAGVRDSEVFLMFLTNSLLSRPFCLKEIGWALDFDKPIVIVVETENRFWPFDLKRWQTNQCTKAPDGSWTTGWLSRTYEQCPERIRTLVESHKERQDASVQTKRLRAQRVAENSLEIVRCERSYRLG